MPRVAAGACSPCRRLAVVRRGDRPLPPGSSKVKGTHYLHRREDDEHDEAQFANWVKQAVMLPGERIPGWPARSSIRG